MILSHKHKFILLHAGKCAGTADYFASVIEMFDWD